MANNSSLANSLDAMEKKVKSGLTEQMAWQEELDALLGMAETDGVKNIYKTPRFPIILIVGASGSGTTLFLQWLASTGVFAYPSNLMARFYRSLYIAAKMQLMLSEPDLSMVPRADIDFFSSNLGKTYGLFAPNGFDVFWRRFFPFKKINSLSPDKLKTVDAAGLKSELAAMEAVFQKPLALKALSCNWHLPFLAQHLPNTIFVHISRQPFYNAQCILRARQRLKQPATDWYGEVPPEYTKLKKMNIYKQVCAQLYHTELAISKGLKNIPEYHKLEIDYEAFCTNPAASWDSLNRLFNRLGFTMHRDYSSVHNFENQNKLQLSKREKERLAAAYYSLFGEDITPAELRADKTKNNILNPAL